MTWPEFFAKLDHTKKHPPKPCPRKAEHAPEFDTRVGSPDWEPFRRKVLTHTQKFCRCGETIWVPR